MIFLSATWGHSHSPDVNHRVFYFCFEPRITGSSVTRLGHLPRQSAQLSFSWDSSDSNSYLLTLTGCLAGLENPTSLWGTQWSLVVYFTQLSLWKLYFQLFLSKICCWDQQKYWVCWKNQENLRKTLSFFDNCFI